MNAHLYEQAFGKPIGHAQVLMMCVDNSYTTSQSSYIYCVCNHWGDLCVTLPSICEPCPSSVI
jgi:hypothetical protein